MTTDQIVSVIAVRNAIVSTSGAMLVSFVVRRAIMRWRARRSIAIAHIDCVIVYMIAVHMVHVSIMEVALMIVVLYSLVTTAFSVLMIVLAVNFTRHSISPFPISKT